MHEAGLARAILRTLETYGRTTTGLRVTVSAGAHDPAAFEAALRLHLAAMAPDLDVAALEIHHRPVARPCLACGRSFEAIAPDAACPACGGPGLPPVEGERIELEWDSDDPSGRAPGAPGGPPLRDRRPSPEPDGAARMGA